MSSRREFLAGLPAAALSQRSRAGALPGDIPTAESNASVRMTHRFGDVYGPPGLTNFLGCVQSALDATAVRALSFPPYAQGEMSMDPLANRGDATGVLFVDGEYAAARRETIEFQWFPDRIERRSTTRAIEIASTTILPPARQAVAVRVRVTNRSAARRRTEIKLVLQGGVVRSVALWDATTPGERFNNVSVDDGRSAVVFGSQQGHAFSAQGAWPEPSRVTPGALAFDFDLGPGERREFVFAVALGDTESTALDAMQEAARGFDAFEAACRKQWDDTLAAAFTPGNTIFSGYLPSLATTDPGIRRLFNTALITLLFQRRTTAASVYGTTYVTLAPRYWETTSFLWDTSLSAMMLALLDPEVLRRMMETWMELDVHKHFGTEYLTGAGVGPWYSVNDFAMCRMAREYLRWTGDRAWLDRQVGNRNVIDHLVSYATHWRTLDTNGHGLADYGGVENLLEAVSSYVHEVASLNAANVWCLRFVSQVLTLRGDTAGSSKLRAEASALARRVLDLYVPGKGIWHCRLPDGRMQEVRHCYDFATVLATIGQDLSVSQKKEMVAFFRRELQTPAWMRALSTHDADVAFSVRPDHQWTGAYAAWPAISLTALYAAGEPALALEWMHGIARTATQGPIAQAHFSETAFDPETGGGARKSSSDMPYINDWSCISGSAFLDPIVEGLFGVNAALDGAITAAPRFAGFDPKAELRGLRYQGTGYMVSASGVRRER